MTGRLPDLTKLWSRFGRKLDLTKERAEFRRIPPSVIAALAEFCGANAPAPLDPNALVQARAAGRRDVWLFLQTFLCLSEAEIYAHLRGQPLSRPQETNNGR